MSCIPSIPSKLSRAEMKLAKKQKLKYSSPSLRPSLLRRLELLARDFRPSFRGRAAADYRLPLALQAELVNDPEPSVREQLAGNPHISWDTFRALAEDTDEYVRGHLILNRNCPYEIVSLTAGSDPSERVRHLAEIQLPLVERRLVG